MEASRIVQPHPQLRCNRMIFRIKNIKPDLSNSGKASASLQLTSQGCHPWGCQGSMAPLDFGRSVNPISTRGTDYAHLITTGTPGFSDLPTALKCSPWNIYQVHTINEPIELKIPPAHQVCNRCFENTIGICIALFDKERNL